MPLNRRELLRALAAAGAATSGLPAFASASVAESFDRAVDHKPWLAAFKGIGETTQALHCDALRLTGNWPATLRGRFYRNGPALFERHGERHPHWFAGDGMVQQFTLGDSGVSHLGRLVQTPKLLAEQQAGRFLYNAFSARHPDDPPVGGPDAFNTANTNALEHGGRLLAMWEGGSAFAMDPSDLATTGAVTWGDGLQQMPFSAHPKVDRGGHLWNIGTSGTRIVAWHIDPHGRLAKVQVGESPYPGGMVHDMAVTPRYLVVPLPPLKQDFPRMMQGGSPAEAFVFEAREPLRILVMEKDDITRRRVFELPAQMVFHVGNAHETADGGIVLSFVGAADHRSLVENAVSVMDGRGTHGRVSRTQWARLDMRTGRATSHAFDDRVEFPRIDPRRTGLPARQLLTTATWRDYPDTANVFHGVQLRDMESGRMARYDYGDGVQVEEHIVVPRPGGSHELDAWLLGTTVDFRRHVTVLNLLDARHLADGPIAQATLPYALPPGFHGNFTAA